MKAAEVRAIFDRLKEVLIPLVEAARAGGDAAGDRDVPGGRPSVSSSLEIVQRFGFDDTAWRLDTAPHPFAQSLATSDIRITTREPEDSLDGLFATMHECGHGLYEYGVDPALERTPLARGASLGLHESQSRLWENLVGRSRPVLELVLSAPAGDVPDAARLGRRGDVVPLDQRRRARADPHRGRRGVVQPAHHPALRARAADHGRARPARAARTCGTRRWRSTSASTCPNDARGVLQDVHWSRGGFGYFPTYSLGNVISVQIWERLREDVDDVDEQIARGEFGGDSRVAAREPAPARAQVHARRRRSSAPSAGRSTPSRTSRYLQGKLAAA